ncbi:MAG: cadherin domain-containing protein [Desulfobulbaceae bacterium]|nr:cadherin domain-containing protein [Desulfobulbaceae bacterium]
MRKKITGYRYGSPYQKNLFNSYGVDEAYLVTRRQRRAVQRLLEKAETGSCDPKKNHRLIREFTKAYTGSPWHRRFVSSVTVMSLVVALQVAPSEARTLPVDSTVFQGITQFLNNAQLLLVDGDSDVKEVSDKVSVPENVSLHLSVGHASVANGYIEKEAHALVLDDDSDLIDLRTQNVLTVIDTSVADWRTMKSAVSAGEVLLLEENDDSLAKILAKLESMEQVSAINIFSHGSKGRLHFQDGVISTQALEDDREMWATISRHLSKDGDIQLFGCNVAQGEEGKLFIQTLADITGADVAASMNPTGNEHDGADWELEVAVGQVDRHTFIDHNALHFFRGVLAWTGTINFDNVQNEGSYSGGADYDASVLNAPGGAYTLVADGLSEGTYHAGYFGSDYNKIYTNQLESQLTLYFSGGASFDATSILISNCSGTAKTFKLTSEHGDSATSSSIDDIGSQTVNMSGFTGISKLYITNNAGGLLECISVDDFAVTDVAPNTPPTLGGTFTTAGTVNDNATTTPFSGVTVADADGNLVSVSISYTAANGTLSGTGLTGSAGSYTVTSALPATLTSNLQNLVFTPTPNQVAVESDVVTTFSLTPNDGWVNGTPDSTTQITATSINDNPTITSNGGGTTASVNAAENQTAVTTVTATDVDPGTILTYSISGGVDAAKFSINGSTGVLTFTSAPDYDSPADIGGNNVYDVQVTVTDNGLGNLTDVQDIAVTVTNVNENPVITSNGGGATASVNAPENQTAVTTVTATDQDAADTLIYSISGGADQAKFAINGSTGVLTFLSAPNFEAPTDSGANGIYDVQVTVTDNGSGTLTDVQDIAVTVTNANENPVITSNGGGASASTAIDENTTNVTTVTATDVDSGTTLTYSISGGADEAKFSINGSTGVLAFASAPDYDSPADIGGNNVYDVQVTVTDNGIGNLTDVQDIAVTVNNVNENPVITSNGGGATASVNAPENQTAVTTVTATDQDAADTLTYSISGGTDQAMFGINGSTGVLTFLSAPNYETPSDSDSNNVYDVHVTVTDDGSGTLTDVQDIAVTVTNANENPVITSNGGGATASTSVDENTTNVTTVTATDVDSGTTLTYSISGGADSAKFSINGSTGVLTFGSGPDYETPTDSGSNNVYDVQVKVTDNGTGNLTDVQDIAVTVNNVNEAPVITSNGGGATASVNAPENQTTVTTVTATDEDTADTLTYSISGGADQAKFNINGSTGVLTFVSAPDYDSPADIGGNNVYDVQVTVADNGTGNLTDVQDIAVTVTNANVAPVITSNGGGASASTSVNENTTAVTTVTATDDDSGTTLTYSISGGADAVKFNINGSTGVLTFGSVPNYESPSDSGSNNVYDVQVTVTDDSPGNLTDVQDIAVTVNNVNEAPDFTGTPSISGIPKTGETLSLVDTGTKDEDGDSVTLSYQWHSDDVDIAGAVSATYTLTTEELLKTITCTITADDGQGGITPFTTAGFYVKNKFPWNMFIPIIVSPKNTSGGGQ